MAVLLTSRVVWLEFRQAVVRRDSLSSCMIQFIAKHYGEDKIASVFYITPFILLKSVYITLRVVIVQCEEHTGKNAIVESIEISHMITPIIYNILCTN